MRFDLNISYGRDDGSESFSGTGTLGEFCMSGADVEVSSKVSIHSDSSVDANEASEEGDFSTRNTSMDSFGLESEQAAAIDVDVLRDDAESKIRVGSAFETFCGLIKAYRKYAKLMGFSVRKGNQGYFKGTLHVCSKGFVCSCAGLTDNKRSKGKTAAYKKQTYRSNCQARLRAGRASVGAPWIVTLFYKEHNHELFKPSESYLLHSARSIQEPQKSLLMSMKSSGIGISHSYRFLEKKAGSRANIGFTRNDVYNEMNREARRSSKVENLDVNRLLEFFTVKGRSDPSFYWKVKVGDDDYRHFGDVVSVDATYKTNKYDLICVPIVGINYHRTNVMFAVAFLLNERTESYTWLFETFLESMYQKEPSIIFSDQDQALMNGLDLTFHEACHRLCQWHVNKNAAKQFGKLNHHKGFKELWHRCMNGCECEEEFESTWMRLIVEHNLAENRWFSNMYNLRKRWSSAFTRDKFSGGLHATSRSEVTNKVIKDLCSSTSSVHDFVIGFESILKSWRLTEFEDDALCRGLPGMFVQQTGILLQVGLLCTRNIFKSFEYESLNSVCCKLTHEPPDLNGEVLVYKVSSRTAVAGFRTVSFNQVTKMGRCSCHMWETEGIMCRHFFRVYFHLNMDSVPDDMLLKQWRRDSKARLGDTVDAIDDFGTNMFNNMIFVNHNTKRVYDMLVYCKDDSICRNFLNEYICNMEDGLEKLRNDMNIGRDCVGSQKNFHEQLHRPVKNPISKKPMRKRRKIFSKYWGGRGLEANDDELDILKGSEVAGTQTHNKDFNNDSYRFSVD